MGSDESHFNVLLMVRSKSQDSVQNSQLLKTEKRELKSGIKLMPSTHPSNTLSQGEIV